MKKKIIFAGLWLSSLALAGCSLVPPHINDRYGSVAPLSAYFRRMATLTPELLNKESIQAEQAFKEKRGEVERIKLAMLLGVLVPQEKRDETRAIRLLDAYINNNAIENEALKDYSYTLRYFLAMQQEAVARENVLKERYNILDADHDADHKSSKERYSVLETKLREEAIRNEDLQRKLEELQLKLDTLKAIEESIRRRTK